MNTEATPVVLVYISEDSYRRGEITMLAERDGRMVPHRVIDQRKIIDGDNLIVKTKITETVS